MPENRLVLPVLDLFLPFIEGTGLNPANNFGKSSKHHPDIKMFFYPIVNTPRAHGAASHRVRAVGKISHRADSR